MNNNMTTDRLDLDKLVESQSNYEANIHDTLRTIHKDKNIENALRKVIIFCKYALGTPGHQKKKYLCLHFIKDLSENFKIQLFEKTLDQHIPSKIMKLITSQFVQKQLSQSKSFDDDEEYSRRIVDFAVETVCFWTRKLTHFSIKSNFSEIFEEIKKIKLPIPKVFEYYKMEKILTGIFGQKDEHEEEFIKNQQMSPLCSELHEKFEGCKSLISQRLNMALQNEQQIYLKDLLQKIRDFLLMFFSRYKALEGENTIDRDVLIVYFHIMNALFKSISNRIYIQTFEMIALTKEIFQRTYSSDFSSIDRMDIVNLAGIHKYNALTIFQRIHQRIEEEEKKLGVCQITIEQQQNRDKEREKERDKEMLKKNAISRDKLQIKSRITNKTDIDDKKFNRKTTASTGAIKR